MRLIILIIGCFVCFLKAQAQEQPPTQLVQTVQASLVEVRTFNSKTFNAADGRQKMATYHTQGSGIIIDSHGLIVTNTHIVAHAPRILVGLSDGTVLEARIVYSSDADFSFLKVDPPYPLSTINWADSSQAQPGTSIIALTNADDGQHILGGAITNAINGVSSNNVEAFELNLNLYPGDSGGPVLDSQGNFLGMIMGKKNDEDNKSYAIASNKIRREYEQYRNQN